MNVIDNEVKEPGTCIDLIHCTICGIWSLYKNIYTKKSKVIVQNDQQIGEPDASE